MAWWNDHVFLDGLTAGHYPELTIENFPAAEQWEADPGSPDLRKIGARNVLQAYHEDPDPAFSACILDCKWLVRTSPLPGVARGTRAIWKWLMRDAVVCPVFVPGVLLKGEASLFRFDIVLPHRGKVPAAIARAARLAEQQHGDSVRAARTALGALDRNIPANWLVLVEGGARKSRDASGSLGIALAAWAAYCHCASTAHEAMPALARRFSVTGELARNGRIRPVGELAGKTKLAAEGRMLLAPLNHNLREQWVTQANTWSDACARIAPRYTGGEHGRFPPCEVLIGFASKETEPHLKYVAELKPKRVVILFHSDNDELSVQPALRIKRCLERNAGAWGGRDVSIELELIDSRRPHLVEMTLDQVIAGWIKKGVRESAIVINMTGGNKLMAIAAANVARRGCPLLYLERGDQEYSVIGYGGSNRLGQTSFVPETKGILDGFDAVSVEICKNGSNSSGKRVNRRLP